MKKKAILTLMFILLLFTRIIGADSKNNFVIELDTEKFTGSSVEWFIEENNYDELVSKNNELIELAIKNIESEIERNVEISAKGNFIFCFITTDLTSEEAKKILTLDYVKSVSIENEHKKMEAKPRLRRMAVSERIDASNLIGIDKSISDEYDGTGKLVAVIDGNFSPSHHVFKLNNSNNLKLKKSDIVRFINSNSDKFKNTNIDELYINEKVPFGFHYINRNANLNPEKNPVGHGQHVSGIAVGNEGLVMDKYKFKGVAPNAQLLTLNVFANESTGSSYFLEALNDAVYLRADVVNMSFGATKATEKGYNSADKKVKELVNFISKKTGTTVVIAAGNDGALEGDLSIDYPDIGNMASPGILEGAITVAAVENEFYIGQAINIAGKNLTYNKASSKGLEKGRYFISDCKKALSIEDCKSARGRIALIERGENSFSQKIKNAKEAGAVAAIIYNNMPGELLMSIEDEDSIPSYSISMDDGKFLLSNTDRALDIEEGEKILKNSNAGKISTYSNWGLTADGELKPDLAAPGSNIYSADNNDGFVTKTGTSMAAPHVSGAVAVMSQAIDKNPIFKNINLYEKSDLIKTLLMNSAEPQTDSNTNANVSPRKQGAGLINVKRALDLDFTVLDSKTNKASVFEKNVGSELNVKLKVKNFSNRDKYLKASYVFSIDDHDGKKNLMRPKELFAEDSEKEYFVGANSEAIIDLNITFKNTETLESFSNGAFIEGYISLDDGEKSATLPVVTFKGDFNSYPVVEKPIYKMDFENEFPMYWNFNPRVNKWHKFMTHIETDLNGESVVAGMENFKEVDEGKKNGEIVKPVFSKRLYFSPNGDGNYDKLNLIAVVTKTANFKVVIKNSDGEAIYEKELPEYSYKNISNWADNPQLDKRSLGYTAIDGIDIKNLEDGDYTLELEGVGVAEGSVKKVEKFEFTVDKIAPEIVNINKDENGVKFEVKDESDADVFIKYKKEDGKYAPYPEYPDWLQPKYVDVLEKVNATDGVYTINKGDVPEDATIVVVDKAKNEFSESWDNLLTDEKLYDVEIIAMTKDGEKVPVKYEVQSDQRQIMPNPAKLKAGTYYLMNIEAPMEYKLVETRPKLEYRMVEFTVGEDSENKVELLYEKQQVGKRLVLLNGSGLISYNDFKVIAESEEGERIELKPEVPNTPQFYLKAPYGKYKLKVEFTNKSMESKYDCYFSQDTIEIDSPSSNSYVDLYFKETKYSLEPITEGYEGKVDYIGLNLLTGIVSDAREVGMGKIEVAPKNIPDGYYVVPGMKTVIIDEKNPVAKPVFKFIKDSGKRFELVIKDDAEQKGINAKYMVYNFNERYNVKEGAFEQEYTPGMKLKPGFYVVEAIQTEQYNEIVEGAEALEPDPFYNLNEKVVEFYGDGKKEIAFTWFKKGDAGHVTRYSREINVNIPDGYIKDSLELEFEKINESGENIKFDHIFKFDDDSTKSILLEEGQYKVNIKDKLDLYEYSDPGSVWVFGPGGEKINIDINLKENAPIKEVQIKFNDSTGEIKGVSYKINGVLYNSSEAKLPVGQYELEIISPKSYSDKLINNKFVIDENTTTVELMVKDISVGNIEIVPEFEGMDEEKIGYILNGNSIENSDEFKNLPFGNYVIEFETDKDNDVLYNGEIYESIFIKIDRENQDVVVPIVIRKNKKSIDISKLSKLIEEVERIKDTKRFTNSEEVYRNNFITALDNAKKVLESDYTPNDVKKATDNLELAIELLSGEYNTELVDELKNYIADYNNFKNSGKFRKLSNEDKNRYENFISAGKNLLNVRFSESEIKEVLDGINSIVNKEIPNPNPNPNPNPDPVPEYRPEPSPRVPHYRNKKQKDFVKNTEKGKKKKFVEEKNEISFTIDNKKFVMNNEKLEMDVEPFIKNDRIMVPLRFVGVALGYEVSWDQKTQTAILTKGENIIKIPMFGKEFTVNGKKFMSDAEPVVVKDRIFLSLSNIGKALGLVEGKDIVWYPETKTAKFIIAK